MSVRRCTALCIALGVLVSQALPCIPATRLDIAAEASRAGDAPTPIMIAACLCGCDHGPTNASPISHELVLIKAETAPDAWPRPEMRAPTADPTPVRLGSLEPPSPPPRSIS